MAEADVLTPVRAARLATLSEPKATPPDTTAVASVPIPTLSLAFANVSVPKAIERSPDAAH